MTSKTTSILVFGVIVSCIHGQANADQLARERIVGSYSSVSESECNIELTLLEEGKAKITETCRREDGSNKDDTERLVARWTLRGDQLVLRSGK